MSASDMPVFILKAKDVLSVWTIETYRRECVRYGLIEQSLQVDLALGEIKRWQAENPELVHLPDHKHVPAGGS